MSNIIEVYPIAGKTAYTASAWQYDYGQTLHLNGIVLPASYKAEFSNTTRGNAIPTVQTTDTVVIPAQFLESGESVYIWLVMVDEESRITEYSIIVPIAARARPTDEEPTPEEQSEIDQALVALNGGVDRVERIADAIPDTIADALTEAKESGEFDGPKGDDYTLTDADKAEIAQLVAVSSTVTVSGTTPVIIAQPGIQYVCGEVATIDITLPASGCIDVVFESGSIPAVLTVVPSEGTTVKWANGFDPNALNANTIYEINIKDGLGVAGAWT